MGSNPFPRGASNDTHRLCFGKSITTFSLVPLFPWSLWGYIPFSYGSSELIVLRKCPKRSQNSSCEAKQYDMFQRSDYGRRFAEAPNYPNVNTSTSSIVWPVKRWLLKSAMRSMTSRKRYVETRLEWAPDMEPSSRTNQGGVISKWHSAATKGPTVSLDRSFGMSFRLIS